MLNFFNIVGKVMKKIGILGVMDEEVVLFKVLFWNVKEI